MINVKSKVNTGLFAIRPGLIGGYDPGIVKITDNYVWNKIWNQVYFPIWDQVLPGVVAVIEDLEFR